MVDHRFADLDLKGMLKRLTACALKWFVQEGCYDEDSVLPGTAQSAKDLAYGAVLEVLRDQRIRWKPKRDGDDPFPLFVTVMRHDFLDLVKEGREYKRTEILDPTDPVKRQLEELPDSADGFRGAEAAALAAKLYPMLDGDSELKEYVDAVLLIGLDKREDIADLLDTTPEDISKRRRKLQIKLAKWHRSVKAQR